MNSATNSKEGISVSTSLRGSHFVHVHIDRTSSIEYISLDECGQSLKLIILVEKRNIFTEKQGALNWGAKECVLEDERVCFTS